MSHKTDNFNCPSKVKLNTFTDELLPTEVLQYEQKTEESEMDTTQVEVMNLSVTNTNHTGLNTLKPVPT